MAAQHAGFPLLPYRCDRCRQFHLTSRTKGKRCKNGKDHRSVEHLPEFVKRLPRRSTGNWSRDDLNE